MDCGSSVKPVRQPAARSALEMLDAISNTAQLIATSDSTAAAAHRVTLQRLVANLRQTMATSEAPERPEGTSSTIESYRRKVMQLTAQLELARSGKWSAPLPPKGPAADDAHARGVPTDGCACCGSATCVHKQVLASRIVDLTFDAHKNLLRDRLRSAEEELESYRNGSLLREKNEEIASLRSALVDERFRCEQVKSELHQAKIDQFLERQATRAASSSGGGSSHRLSSLMTSAKEMELLARHTWYQSEVARTIVHMMRWHETMHEWRDAQLGHFLQHSGARDGRQTAAMLLDPPTAFSAVTPPTSSTSRSAVGGNRHQFSHPSSLQQQQVAMVETATGPVADASAGGDARRGKASREYLAQFGVRLSPARGAEAPNEEDDNDAEPPLSQRTMDRLGGLRFRPQLPTQRLSRTPTFSTTAPVSNSVVAGLQEDLLLGSRRPSLGANEREKRLL